ncbi:hypothetical protein BDZ89DRAFT_1162717 [Hymenopellis radicata]|nr:hypothetical protein BDZ89DRAFT_1162717 [Hymenopellis radicata]
MSPRPRNFHALPAERARHMKRAPLPQPITIDEDGFTLTGPIVITVTRAVDESTTTSTSSSSSRVPATTTVFTVKSASSTQAASSSQPSTFVAASSSISASSVPQPSANAVSSPSATTAGGIAQDSQSGNIPDTGLPAGAIVGIVIGCLLLVAGVILFFLRNRLMQRRRLRSARWLEKPSVTPFSFSTAEKLPYSNVFLSSSGTDSATMSPGTQFGQAQARALAGGAAFPAAPGASYNNNASLAVPSQDGAFVMSTFIPSLPDELSISMGETVRILQEFDDGWALCANGGGERGMVPLECLNKTGGATSGKRESSLHGVSTTRR